MILSFDTHGNEKQKECARRWADKTTTDIVYGGSKGGAKSFTGVSLIFGSAFMYPGTHWFIARKKLNDLRKHTIPSIHEVFKIWGITEGYYKYNGQDNFFELHNGSRVYLIDAKWMPSDPLYARFGSMQMTGGWIEEAGEFELEAKNNLSAAIGRWMNDVYGLPGKLLQSCNPQKNYLYADYYKPFKEGTLEPWKAFIQAFPQDNKKLPDGYLEHLHRTLSPNEKERLLYGNWEFDDDPNALFDYVDILNIFTNEFVVSNSNAPYLTADIAYEGADRFVMMVWRGLAVVHIEAIDKCDDTMVSKKITDLAFKYQIPRSNIIYDADGMKTFTAQSTRTGNLQGARPFNNNGKPLYGENYANLKAQCYFKLAELVKENKVYIRDQTWRKQIIEELEQIKKISRHDDTEKLSLEKKEEVKERLKRSPDFADAMMMRCIVELKPKLNSAALVAGMIG